jgi:hypothetical protein
VAALPLDEGYFQYLYAQVGSTKNKNLAQTYWKLCRLLHDKEFTWDEQTMENDGNRAQDGKDLRNGFRDANGLKETRDYLAWVQQPCSVFEMMIALAFGMAWESEHDLQYWFWEMVKNIGLLECTDANPPEPIIVDHVLNQVLNRDYGENGHGGFFPLKVNAKQEDQRHVELWYQANAYILEQN